MKFFFKKFTNLLSSQTAKDTYWVFSGNIFTAFLAFLYTIFLARRFSPSEFGVFSAILAFILLVSDVGDLGIGTSLSRFLPGFVGKGKAQTDSFLKTAFAFQLSITFILFVIILLSSNSLSKLLLNNRDYGGLFLLAAVGIIGTIMLAFTTYSLSAQKKFREVSFLNSISTITKLIFVVLLFNLNLLSIISAVSAFVISSFVGLFFSLFFFSWNFLKATADKNNLRKLLSYSLYIGVSRVFSAISSRLDVLMIIPLSSSFEAGIYSAAYKIAVLYVLLSSSFSMVVAPRLASFSDIAQALAYLKKIIIVVIVIISSMVIVYIVAPWFVPLILGKNYILSIPVFRALLLPMALFTMTLPPVNLLLYVFKKPQVSAFNTFVQLVIILVGNTYLIPKFGRFGPVITLSLVYGFTFTSASLFSLYLLKKTHD